MNFEQSISQNQTLTQKLNQNQLQSLNLLALPLARLHTELQKECDVNPALELGETRIEEAMLDNYIGKDFVESSDEGQDNLLRKEYRQNKLSNHDLIEKVLSPRVNLHEHLLWQLHLQIASKSELELGELLINNLDPKGFFIEEPLSLSKKYPRSAVRKMLAQIQVFDPIGVCTANSIESLLVQAQNDPECPDLVVRILQPQYSALLEDKNKLEQLAGALSAGKEELEDAIDYIASKYYPFPGNIFSSWQPQYISPDLILREENGSIVIRTNDEDIPLLSVNPDFLAESIEFSDGTSANLAARTSKETDKFIRNFVSRAKNIKLAMENRTKTIYRVALEIFKVQKDFLAQGVAGLKVLKLKDIAENLELHQSTISRAVTQKYILTPHGLFELKFFLSSGLTSTNLSAERSREAIKEEIRQILAQHREKRISDEQIRSILLKEKEVEIARRTVSKYRLELKNAGLI